MNNKALKAHLMMAVLIIVWGFEYVCAKVSQTVFEPMTVVLIKYCISALVLLMLKIVTRSHTPIRRRDIPVFFVCALLGEFLYFYCEYTAMDYMPLGLITVMLTFVPVASILTERVLYKVKPTATMVAGIFICIAGVAVIIGIDIEDILAGKFVGYLLCLGAVMCWNLYNFVTEPVSKRYDPFSLSFNQMICVVILTMPSGIAHFPGLQAIADHKIVILTILYQGLICAGMGFSMYIYSLNILGSTPLAIYNSFLPVTTSISGWLILGEELSIVQMIAMAVVIASGVWVIMEKAKIDKALGTAGKVRTRQEKARGMQT